MKLVCILAAVLISLPVFASGQDSGPAKLSFIAKVVAACNGLLERARDRIPILNSIEIREAQLYIEMDEYLTAQGFAKYQIENLLRDGFDTEQPGSSLQKIPALSLRRINLSWIIEGIRSSPIAELRYLAVWYPIWEKSPYRQAILKEASKKFTSLMITERRYEFHLIINLMSWLLATTGQEERGPIFKIAKRMIEEESAGFSLLQRKDPTMLSLVSLLPFKQLPAKFRKSLERDWINFKTNPPLRMNHVKPLHFGATSASYCGDMFDNHYCATLRPRQGVSEIFPFVTILVRNHAIGTLKMFGERTMLALRNVIDQKGRLILVAGGVYRLSQKLIDEIEDSELRAINFESLRVTPNSFLLRHSDGVLQGIWYNTLSEDLAPELHSDIQDEVGDLRVNERNLHALWQLLLKKIQAASLRLEEYHISRMRDAQ